MLNSVSVVIPVHNGERYLAEAIESVLSNRPLPTEIVVVDDGSTDNSPLVAKKFSEVRYLRQDQSGPGAARHLGVQHCVGDYVALLDADDLWTPNKLERQLDWLAQHADWDGVFGAAVQFLSPELDAEQRQQLEFDPLPRVAQLPSALLFRRAAYDRAGPFLSDFQVGEFIDWCLRAQEAGCRFGNLPEVVLRRRLHGNNQGRRLKEARQDYARIVAAALRRRRSPL
jgi:glycosyltransferase involved in cell wall biosynthesis